MPRNPITDPTTYQEMTFARLVLSGTMTDRQAAEAVGLNPDSDAYTKSKPRVRAYMLEHRAAVEQQLIDEDVDEQHRLKQTRDRVLARIGASSPQGRFRSRHQGPLLHKKEPVCPPALSFPFRKAQKRRILSIFINLSGPHNRIVIPTGK